MESHEFDFWLCVWLCVLLCFFNLLFFPSSWSSPGVGQTGSSENEFMFAEAGQKKNLLKKK